VCSTKISCQLSDRLTLTFPVWLVPNYTCLVTGTRGCEQSYYAAASRPGVETTSLAEKLFVGNLADGIGDRTVVDDRRLTTIAAVDMAIHAVVTRVQLAADEPEAPESNQSLTEHRVTVT